MLVEKYIENGHHIEIQVVGDDGDHGDYRYDGEDEDYEMMAEISRREIRRAGEGGWGRWVEAAWLHALRRKSLSSLYCIIYLVYWLNRFARHALVLDQLICCLLLVPS